MKIAELHRISVSRPDAVESGLIKMGVRCAAYFVDPEKRALVDLEGTALRDGVAAHRRIKQKLEEMKVPLVPLLLVQADSQDKSVERLKVRLLRMGFTDEQVAVHTAEEPDSGLLALANEPRREVLIFKMAVALGFDAPRAFTLVSMRASRDSDFGIQLVGRILRVHRLLQGRAQAKTLPQELTHGLVFLASAETQTGLDIAGQKINAIQTEFAKASTATVVLRFGESLTGVGQVDKRGQIELFGLEPQVTGGGQNLAGDEDETETPEFEPPTSFDFGQFFGSGGSPGSGDSPDKAPKHTAGPTEIQRYALRSGMPRGFKTQVVSAQNEVTEEDCANRFIVSTRDLFEVMRNRIPVEKRTLDVFTHEMQQEFNFAADLSPSQAAQAAEKVLLKNKAFDPRELRRALLRKMEMVMRDETMAEADDRGKAAHFLDVILATHPELLWEAQKKALAESAEIIEAANLPDEFLSPDYLPKSPPQHLRRDTTPDERMGERVCRNTRPQS
jgi:type III restriction enzyme